MPRNIQLLKQVRRVTSLVNQHSSDPEHRAMLSVVDLYLNELMLRESPELYLELLRDGEKLVADGRTLAGRCGTELPPLPAAPRTIDADTRFDVINARFKTLNDALLPIVHALDENRSTAEKDFLRHMSRWESRWQTHHLDAPSGVASAAAYAITPQTFRAYLEKKFPQWAGLTITRFMLLEGGVSKATILVDTNDTVNGSQSLVVRAEQPVNMLYFGGSDVAREFYMIQLMHRMGLPAPEPLWLEADAGALGHRFLVTRKAEGSIIGSSLGAKQRPSDLLVDRIMALLYRLHALKIDPDDPLAQKSHLAEWLPHKTVTDSIRHCVTEYLPGMARRAGVSMTPQLLRCLRWLQRNVPECTDEPVVVHYDLAYNNILVHNDAVSALLDWETSFIGDPASEIAHTQHNLGVYSMPEFLALYKAHTGREVTPFRLAYARLVRATINQIAGPTSVKALDDHDDCPLHMGVMAFKYMPTFGTKVDQLIAAAEACQ